MRRRIAAAVLAGLLASACSKSTPTSATDTTTTDTTTTTTTTVTVSSVTISGGPVATGVGQRLQLAVIATNSDGTTVDATRQVAWLNADPTIAIVSPNGVVTTIKRGITHITAVYQTVTGGIDLAVAPVVTTIRGTVKASTGETGTFTLTVQGDLAPTATSTSADVSGTMQIGKLPAYALQGDFAAATGVLVLTTTDAPLRFTAAISNRTVSGSYTGPDGQAGTFTSTTVTVAPI